MHYESVESPQDDRADHLSVQESTGEDVQLRTTAAGPGITDVDDMPEPLTVPEFVASVHVPIRETVTVTEREVPSVRRPGELEQRNPTIEPLPPTPIALDAEDRLREWGLSAKQIGQLQEYASSFRYDLVPERVGRIIANGVLVHEASNGVESIVLPGFHDYKDRGDGYCTDVAVQLIGLLRSSGFVDEVNMELRQQRQPEIGVALTSGAPSTHFLRTGDAHSWIELIPGQDVAKAVVVDVGMQKISNLDANGYRPRVRDRAGHVLEFRTAEVLAPGTIEELRGSVSFTANDPLVLGRSADSAVVYGLGFVEDRESATYGPVVQAILPDGTLSSGYLARRGEIGRFDGEDRRLITREHDEEMRTMIENLTDAGVIFDQQKAEEAMRQEVRVWL